MWTCASMTCNDSSMPFRFADSLLAGSRGADESRKRCSIVAFNDRVVLTTKAVQGIFSIDCAVTAKSRYDVVLEFLVLAYIWVV